MAKIRKSETMRTVTYSLACINPSACFSAVHIIVPAIADDIVDVQIPDEDERHECGLVVTQLIGNAAIRGGRADLHGAKLRVWSVGSTSG